MPENLLKFGKIGDTLRSNDLFRVVAKAPEGSEDLGIRARQVRTITQRFDHPIISRMLQYGSRLSYRFGYGENDEFANTLGKRIREVGSVLAFRNDGHQTNRLTEACFCYVLQQFFGSEKAGMVSYELGIPQKALDDVWATHFLLYTFSRKPKIREATITALKSLRAEGI